MFQKLKCYLNHIDLCLADPTCAHKKTDNTA